MKSDASGKSLMKPLIHLKPIVSDIGTEILILDELPSTMDYAVDLVKKGTLPWTAVIARKQSSGRGTHGRLWFSHESKGLWTSVIIPPPSEVSVLEDLSVATAKCLVECLKKMTGFEFNVKNPNDVVINGLKIAGILFESVTLNGEMNYLILGMGVNLNQNKSDFTENELHEASSIYLETGINIDSDELLIEFLTIFRAFYEQNILFTSNHTVL